FRARASRLPEASANSSSPKRRLIQRILARRNKEGGGRRAKRPIYQNWPSRPEKGTRRSSDPCGGATGTRRVSQAAQRRRAVRRRRGKSSPRRWAARVGAAPRSSIRRDSRRGASGIAL